MAKRKRMTALQRAYFGGGRRRRTAMVRYARPTIIRVNAGAPKKRRGRRRGGGSFLGGGGMKGDLKTHGFNFGAATVYGYARAGHTQNFNEYMDKLPGENFLGKDLRNGAAFYLGNRFLFKGRSRVLHHLTIAAVCRAGDRFGANKMTKLEGDDYGDSVEADMDE